MYLQSADTIERVIIFGVNPAIEFLSLAEDARMEGEEERAGMLELEAKAKLLAIRDRQEEIDLEARKILKPRSVEKD